MKRLFCSWHGESTQYNAQRHWHAALRWRAGGHSVSWQELAAQRPDAMSHTTSGKVLTDRQQGC